MRHSPAIAIALLAAVTAACAGDSGPTGPSGSATLPPAGGASIVSCNSVRYQTQTLEVCRPVSGVPFQPIGSSHYFPGRTDCLKVSCGGGCATSVAVGVVVGGSCQ